MDTILHSELWVYFNGKSITTSLLNKVEEIIIREQKKGHRLKVCIGTDSQVKTKNPWKTDFATVIVFLREYKGGFMLIHRNSLDIEMTIKERMIRETAMSVDVAYGLCGLLDKYNVELEVHADINTDPQFKSNSALKEAMGYILGMGFIFKAKPDAFASSSAADRVI